MKWLAILAMLVAGPAEAANAVLVGALRPQGVDGDLAVTLAELLAGELSNRTSHPVSTEAQAIAALKAGATSQAMGVAVDTEHLAAQFQADFVVTGSVGKVGRIFVLSIAITPLSGPARETLTGKHSHWAIVAEAEPESLIVAAQKGAAAVATTLMSPEEEREAAMAEARQRAMDSSRMQAAKERSRAEVLAARARSLKPARNSTAGHVEDETIDGDHARSNSRASMPPGAPVRREANVEMLAADPEHLETQPQWHALAVQVLGDAEQASLAASLRAKLPARK